MEEFVIKKRVFILSVLTFLQSLVVSKFNVVSDLMVELTTQPREIEVTLFCKLSDRSVSFHGDVRNPLAVRDISSIPASLPATTQPVMNVLVIENVENMLEWLKMMNILMDLTRLVTVNATSDRMYRMLNMFLIVLPLPQTAGSYFEAIQNDTALTANIFLDSEVYIVTVSEVGDLNTWELYSIKDIQVLRQIAYGYPRWRSVVDLIFRPDLFDRRADYFGVTMVVSGVCNHPRYLLECTMQTDESGTRRFHGGLSVSHFADIRDSLNFTEEIPDVVGFLSFESFFEINDTQLLQEYMDKTTMYWILNQTLDLAIAQNVYMPTNERYTSLLQPSNVFSVMVFFAQPLTSPNELFALPYSFHSWIAFALTWIAFFVISSFLKSLPFVLSERRLFVKVSSIGRETSNCFYWLITAMCSKNYYRIPTTTFGKIIVLTAASTSLLLNTAYLAGLTAMIPFYLKPLGSFEDILKSQYVLMTDNNSVSLHSVVQPVLESKETKQPLEYGSTEYALKHLPSGNLAYMNYMDSIISKLLDYCNDTGIPLSLYYCEMITSVPLTKLPIQSGFTAPKHSPYWEHFNLKTIVLIERGLSFRYRRIYTRLLMPSCFDSVRPHIRIGYKDAEVAFYIVLYGYITAFVVLFSEKIARRVIDARVVDSSDAVNLENGDDGQAITWLESL